MNSIEITKIAVIFSLSSFPLVLPLPLPTPFQYAIELLFLIEHCKVILTNT